MSKEEGLMIFGLSNAHAAACLAAVMIGYNLPIGTMQDGTNVYLLGDEILNATIVMVLISCTISSFATERAARKIVIKQDQLEEKMSEEKLADRILIPIYNPETLNSLSFIFSDCATLTTYSAKSHSLMNSFRFA